MQDAEKVTIKQCERENKAEYRRRIDTAYGGDRLEILREIFAVLHHRFERKALVLEVLASKFVSHCGIKREKYTLDTSSCLLGENREKRRMTM